jgi:hypothetical protein
MPTTGASRDEITRATGPAIAISGSVSAGPDQAPSSTEQAPR